MLPSHGGDHGFESRREYIPFVFQKSPCYHPWCDSFLFDIDEDMIEQLVPGIVMAMREWLEALMIVMIITRYLDKLERHDLKYPMVYGLVVSVCSSIAVAYILHTLRTVTWFGPMRESIMSMIWVWLIISFILWMIRHHRHITWYIHNKLSIHVSPFIVALTSYILTAKEGVEIAVFSFVGKYSAWSIVIGLAIAIVLVAMMYYATLHINLKKIWNLTLIYLIIQAGYLCGYSIHEGIQAWSEAGWIDTSHPIHTLAFDLSGTHFDHKNGIIGLPLHVIAGRHSKPQIIQWISQYLLTLVLLRYRYRWSYSSSE